MGFLGFGKDKVIDPWNTMGAPPQAARRLVAPPVDDDYTPGRVELVADLRDAPLEGVARGYGLTLAAAARFRDRFEEALTWSGTGRGFRASVECGDILADRASRKRW